ncbi:MAG: DUF1801 domain-containing protein [Pseudomonadales bacterium]|nr:DUF1801 domain-containing protein [Pseudomonadales bacterium]
MKERKTQETKASVSQFVKSISDKQKREDCAAITKLMRSATKQTPKMWGDAIIGFGRHNYRYANGKPADICRVGFAPRSRSFAFYLSDFPDRAKLLGKMGKHHFSGGCLHITKLADVDPEILTTIIESAYEATPETAP